MYGIKNKIVLVGISSLALVWIVTAVSGAKQQATFYINGNGSVAQVEPKHFVSSPGSACAPAARHLDSWRRWGAERTSSRGQLYYTRPRLCVNMTRRTRGKVVLSHIRHCPSGPHYLRVRFVYSKHRRDDRVINVKCDGYLAPS